MKLIDFHTHIYPEKIAKKATDYLRSFYDLPSEWPGTSENLLIFGQGAGISKFVVLPVASRGDQVRKINDFIIEESKAHDEYITFGSFHPDVENLCGELEYAADNGLKGFKLHPDQQKFSIDDRRLYDAYDFLSSKNLPVLFHVGDPRSDLSHPQRLIKIMKEFPQLRVVAAHFGGWCIFDEAYDLIRNERCFFDMSSSMYFLGKEKITKFIRDYGVEKVFFGTDFPLWDPDVEVKSFMSLDLTEREKDLVGYKNAEEFLGIKI